MKAIFTVLISFFLVMVSFASDEVAFGKDKKITFTVKAAGLSELKILDKESKTIKHLSAGLFTENDVNKIVEFQWDGKNDNGEMVDDTQGPFSVEISFQLKANLKRHLGFDSLVTSVRVSSVVTDPQGNLFVFTTNNMYGKSEVRMLDEKGKYIRTLLPYSNRTKPENLKGIFTLQNNEKELVPYVYSGHAHAVFPLLDGLNRVQSAYHPDGYLLTVSAMGSIINQGPARHLLRINPLGGAPNGLSFVGPEIWKARGKIGGPGDGYEDALDSILLMPDHKSVLLTHFLDQADFKKNIKNEIYQCGLDDDSVPTVFLGSKIKGYQNELKTPLGLVFDQKKNLYICDFGNSKIVVVDENQKFVKSWDVEMPNIIQYNAKDNCFYVVSRKLGKAPKIRYSKISKFSEDGELLAEVEISGYTIKSMCVDARSEKPVKLYCALNDGYKKGALIWVEDTGASLEMRELLLNKNGFRYPMFINVDEKNEKAYVSEWQGGVEVLDLKENTRNDFLSSKFGNEAVPDADGNVVVTRLWKIFLEKRDINGEVLAFDGENKKLGPWPMGNRPDGTPAWVRSKGPHVGDRGHAILPNGDIYLIKMSQYGPGYIDVYNKKGELIKEKIVDGLPHGSAGLSVDLEGNMYIAVNMKPLDESKLFSEFNEVLNHKGWFLWEGEKNKRNSPWVYSFHNPYLYHEGRVVKFSPKGGKFLTWSKDGEKPELPEGALEYQSGYKNWGIAVIGAEWVRDGCSPVPTAGLNWGDPSCSCHNLRIANDKFGRVYVPNSMRFVVDVYSKEGVHLDRIGRYGNIDDGKNEKGDATEIVFGWPAFLDCGLGKLYVSDPVASRIVEIEYQTANKLIATMKK